jgi:multidrug efflux system membrane fusion protein
MTGHRVCTRIKHVGVVLTALATLAGSGNCRKKDPPAPPPPPGVTVSKPVEQEVVEWDEFLGHLESVEFVEVRARVSGLIVSVSFQEGAIVKQGDVLVEVDVRPFQAELDSKKADVARAEAQLRMTEIEFNHLKELMPARSASQIEFDKAEASLLQAKAELQGAEAAVESARLNVEWCRVTAPIGGRISRRYVTPGNLITGGGGQGTLLTTIASIDPIYCYVDADEESVLKYTQLAREGKRRSAREVSIPCFLQLANEKSFQHEGVIDFVDNRMDPTTGTMRGRGVFPNPHGWLMPGFFGRLRVPGTGRYMTLLVPDSAVTTDQNQKQLLIVGADDIVQVRRVTLGALFGDLRSILSGIDPNDRVVVNGLLRARQGAKVSPHEAPISLAKFQKASPGPLTTQVLPAVEADTLHKRPGGAPGPTTERAR